jgi:hypothetical protein
MAGRATHWRSSSRTGIWAIRKWEVVPHAIVSAAIGQIEPIEIIRFHSIGYVLFCLCNDALDAC